MNRTEAESGTMMVAGSKRIEYPVLLLELCEDLSEELKKDSKLHRNKGRSIMAKGKKLMKRKNAKEIVAVKK